MSDLIVRDETGLRVRFTPEAYAARDAALGASALLAKVTDEDSNRKAVAIQAGLEQIARDVEKARVLVKAPVVEFGREIDSKTRAFLEDVIDELQRVSQLLGDFQDLERARIRAAANAENERLEEIEKRKQAELSAARDLANVASIHEKYAEEARLTAPAVPPPARADGQVVRSDWKITVTDLFALARAHPVCVKMIPRMTEIKLLLDSGVSVAGVTAEKVVKVGVRSKPLQPLISI